MTEDEKKAAADKAAADQKAAEEKAAADQKAAGDKAAADKAAADDAAARTRAAALDASKGPKPASTRRAQKTEPTDGEKQPEPTISVNDPASPEARIAQHEQIDRENEERNARNAEAFNRRMKEEQDLREAAAERPEAAIPPTGKQRDENTPDILPDGTTVWRK